jgi:hypothetical protein
MAHKGARDDLTAEYVRELLDYDPENGALTWKRSDRPGWNGKPAGKQFARGQSQIQIGGRGRMYLIHRIIWLMQTGEWPPHQIDHIDGNPSNNRWSNLRLATASENCMNRGLRPDNSTGFPGVSKRRGGSFRAYINKQGKREYLGDFDTAERAYAARCARQKELFGQFSHDKPIVM